MKRTTLPAFIAILLLVAAAASWATGLQDESGSAEMAPEGLTFAELFDGATPIDGVGSYATGFEAAERGDLTLVRVTRPWQGATQDDVINYVLYARGDDAPAVEGADQIVAVPVDSIVTMSTTFLPHLEVLGVAPDLVGIDMAAFVYSEAIRDAVAAGSVIEVGSGPGVDIEQMLALDPDITMVNSYGGDFDAQPTLEDAGIPVIVSGDWVETSPLGRAEWLLFTALFFDELERGQEIFGIAEREYQRLSNLARDAADKPTVLANAPFQGTWAVPAGDSYAAQFIRDAGGEYVFASEPGTGSLFYDIETVFAEASDAEIWINPGIWTSREQGAAEDARFEEFGAYQSGMVFNYNSRLGAGGGNDYFESGAINPHVVLSDLIWVFHPELVPEYVPFYYQKLP